MASTAFRSLIMGPPGSGKGTISSRIVKNFNLKYLASGDLLRSHILRGTAEGQEMKKYVEKGNLVPDDVVTQLILKEVEKLGYSNWLLDEKFYEVKQDLYMVFVDFEKASDRVPRNKLFSVLKSYGVTGFPRTVCQAKALSNALKITCALNLNVPDEVIIDRVKGRWLHAPSGRVYHEEFNPPKVPRKDDITGEDLIQRDDDKLETVRIRLENYKKQTHPVLDYYRKQNLLMEFRGRESNEIWPRVKSYIENITSEKKCNLGHHL